VLSGEICRDPTTNRIDFKFFDIPDKGIVIPSFVFSARRGLDLGLHAIAMVIPNSELSIFLQVNTIFQSWFMRIISRFRVLLEKVCLFLKYKYNFAGMFTIFIFQFSFIFRFRILWRKKCFALVSQSEQSTLFLSVFDSTIRNVLSFGAISSFLISAVSILFL
jgi:hypothetical protein